MIIKPNSDLDENDIATSKNYNEKVASLNIDPDSLHINEENLKNCQDIQALLSKIGQKDQEVQIAKSDNNELLVFKWSSELKTWVQQGKVSNKSLDGLQFGKKNLNGTMYDYVFDVDLEGKKILKLGYNAGQNVYEAAQDFIDTNLLSQIYLEQVADFIRKNTNNSRVSRDLKHIPIKSFIYYSPADINKIVNKICEMDRRFERVKKELISDEIDEINSIQIFEAIDNLKESTNTYR
ncbi:MAG: WD repeat protein Lub1 [Paramarteilia canceri]